MKNVFITGATSGIGKALAYEYSRQKFTVGISARRFDILRKIAENCIKLGGKPIIYELDVQDKDQCLTVVNNFVERTGKIDFVIANAGIAGDDGLFTGNSEMINEILKTNVLGITNTLMPFIPKMKEQKQGTLVCISSVASFIPLPYRGGYAGSKIAIRMIFDSWRASLQKYNINTITICPGFIDTPMVKGPARKFPMKFSDIAAKQFLRIIELGKKSTYIYPWYYKILVWIVQIIPEVIYNFLIKKMFHKTIS